MGWIRSSMTGQSKQRMSQGEKLVCTKKRRAYSKMKTSCSGRKQEPVQGVQTKTRFLEMAGTRRLIFVAGATASRVTTGSRNQQTEEKEKRTQSSIRGNERRGSARRRNKNRDQLWQH